MSEIVFKPFEDADREAVLPQMFAILSANMSRIAPTGSDFDEDRRVWLEYMRPPAPERRILLMYAGGALAGYFQYSVHGDTLLVEEIELAAEYRRTMLFPLFFRRAATMLPAGVDRLEAYINKENTNSRRIAEKLGMEPVGENKSGTSLLYRGQIRNIRQLDSQP